MRYHIFFPYVSMVAEGEQMPRNESALHPPEFLLIRVIVECLVEFSHKPPDCAFHLLTSFQHTSE